MKFGETPIAHINGIPAGPYYIGDPAYAFEGDPKRWDAFLEAVESANPLSPLTTFEGDPVGAFPTAFGDGKYSGFPVDSGMVGFVYVRLLKKEFVKALMEGREDCGKFVMFNEPWTAGSRNGLVYMGSTVIDTVIDDDAGTDDPEGEDFAWTHSTNCEYPED